MNYQFIEFKNTNPSYSGGEYACLQCFDGFRKIKLMDDPQIVADLDPFDPRSVVPFHYVYEDGTLDPVKRKCARHELYGIKK